MACSFSAVLKQALKRSTHSDTTQPTADLPKPICSKSGPNRGILSLRYVCALTALQIRRWSGLTEFLRLARWRNSFLVSACMQSLADLRQEIESAEHRTGLRKREVEIREEKGGNLGHGDHRSCFVVWPANIWSNLRSGML